MEGVREIQAMAVCREWVKYATQCPLCSTEPELRGRLNQSGHACKWKKMKLEQGGSRMIKRCLELVCF